MDLINEAKKVFEIEAQAILDLREKVNGKFKDAVGAILACKGKIVVSGMGKSGQIARKIAATLSSTGSPALYLHPAETSHGDLGVISDDDVIMGISYSGETDEMRELIKFVKRKGLKFISISGNLNSSLALASDIALDVSVRKEACPLNLAPTASTAATLAMGDALAIAALVERGFKEEDFAQYHPGGSLGRKLLTKVKDIMHSGDGVPLVELKSSMKDVISVMTSKDVRGVTGVVDGAGKIVGAITDGDLRRRLEKSQSLLDVHAEDLMSRSPKLIDASEMAEKALFMMEQFAIDNLFVVDKKVDSHKPIGIIDLQDVLKARIR